MRFLFSHDFSWFIGPYSSFDRHANLSNDRLYAIPLKICQWVHFLDLIIFGPRQANLVLIAYASSEGSGEPAHPRSLARTSAARSYKQWVKRNLQTESQIPGPSEWLGMRSYIFHDGMLEDTNSLDAAHLKQTNHQLPFIYITSSIS